MKREVADHILAQNRASYDSMAREFSGTREHFWGELAFLAEHATPGMHVLDLGCGNGRFFPLLRERQISYTGLDNSSGLLAEAKVKYPDVSFVEGDATALPFPDATFDIIFSFATIHHIPSTVLRERFVEEAARVLKRGGTLIITSWYLRVPRHRWTLMRGNILSALGLSRLDRGDLFLTFGKEKHPRYLHAFTLPSLETLLMEHGFRIIGSEIIERSGARNGPPSTKKTQRNILIIAKKAWEP